MPTTENDRRNQQTPVLENPSFPDHDRRKDAGMRSAFPDPLKAPPTSEGIEVGLEDAKEERDERNAPDQEFQQMLDDGLRASQGRIPDDPNNRLTSDESLDSDDDPEDRGDSTVDDLNNDKH